MAKKTKKTADENAKAVYPEVHAPARLLPITDTVITNYMPYVMSVIVSRAIPEIDGFKPSQRKLLYTMYKMGLMTGPRTKSTNVVGQTMRLNPHGDASIYETMVRLTRGNAALLHPFIDSKGTFGKHYSSEMAYAASRYTEVKLDSFCSEIFKGIDKDAVDMAPHSQYNRMAHCKYAVVSASNHLFQRMGLLRNPDVAYKLFPNLSKPDFSELVSYQDLHKSHAETHLPKFHKE